MSFSEFDESLYNKIGFKINDDFKNILQRIGDQESWVYESKEIDDSLRDLIERIEVYEGRIKYSDVDLLLNSISVWLMVSRSLALLYCVAKNRPGVIDQLIKNPKSDEEGVNVLGARIAAIRLSEVAAASFIDFILGERNGG